jgi:hypothetical protein
MAIDLGFHLLFLFHKLPLLLISINLKNGGSIELNDGDRFYFIATKCLLIVDIKQCDEPPHNQLQSMILQF